MSLFAPSPIGNTEGHMHLVEMRAGKMFRQGTWVYPDDRKGTIYIYRNSDDLMHFCWRDRLTLMVEDDFIIFPGDCTYFRVKHCTTGRVYVLKFENSSVRMFYWLQEPKIDKDDEHCRRINYLLNHSPVHHNSPSTFNISKAQLSRIFGPEVAAQLSAMIMNDDNTIVAGRSDFNDITNEETKNKHDTTPSNEGVASVSNEKDQKMLKTKKRSSLKSDMTDDVEKRQAKSVTILEDTRDDQEDCSDDGEQKKSNNKTGVSETADYKDGEEEDEQSADANDDRAKGN